MIDSLLSEREMGGFQHIPLPLLGLTQVSYDRRLAL